ncbi:hypothetical protein [Pareuzebyella sediminis]|uniref:hypothetical protein n=1 Tax=Pareuzebyella sediminis TaxID=2607998 RepID=UPI0018E175E7|nr:hypothetical protein [Pareuzebyella sediminis]
MSGDKKGFGKEDGKDAIDKLNKGKGDIKGEASKNLEEAREPTEFPKDEAGTGNKKNFGKGEGEDAIDGINPDKGDLKSEASKATDKKNDASESVKEKAKEFTESAKKKGKEFSEEAKETADEFAKDAKKAANDFKDDMKQTFDPNNPDSGKTVAILAHITVIGWIVAIIMNSQNKTEFGSFYIRQTLGIWILMIILGLIPIVGCLSAIIGLVLIIMSLINAANNKMVPTVGVGHLFQDWFKSL